MLSQEEIDRRVAHARQLHVNGNNCCQAVVLAFQDLLPVDATQASFMAAPFGRGISGLRETCGCVTGMALVCGLTQHVALVRSIGKQFCEEQGSLNCAQLLQTQGPNHSCNDLVACAARLLAMQL